MVGITMYLYPMHFNLQFYTLQEIQEFFSPFCLKFPPHYSPTEKDQSVMDNPFFYPWLAASVISSIYSYIWDIKMDWGLFDKNAPPDNPFLREETVYSSTVSIHYTC
ncbi:xenotropic and polytropic retrovirus receptor 1 homolog [Diaphorina citri]|uniref:Xenotropic and polytropic retrovirus receptor 1 homolog n=1 Tax=Diaphorina citri TaxID=121845 RepID=A0A3Q0JPH7_DIACI|nr:xenotropic and polytropic retrovirus receptor 1 homolog [Diaphorina citri]